MPVGGSSGFGGCDGGRSIRTIWAVGVDAVYGLPLDGTDVVEAPSELAQLFAAAHMRVTGRSAGAHVGDGRIAVLEAPPEASGAPVDEVVAALAAAERPIVLAGPGVFHETAVAGLRALAAAGSLGVLNTWGAKGLFEWTSPHHLATVGLQARDLDLGGVLDADLVLLTGIDAAELPAAPWAFLHGIGGHTVDAGLGATPGTDRRDIVHLDRADGDPQLHALQVAPARLGGIAARCERSAREIPVPPLRSALAKITQEGWARHEGPLSPSRVTLTYREALGADGLVVAEPGVAGFWVARTYPTSAVGGAIVPAEVRPGFAAACAVVSRIVSPDRAVLLVTDAGDPAPTTEAVLAAGTHLGVRPAIERWSVDGASGVARDRTGVGTRSPCEGQRQADDALDADAHAARLRGLLETGGVVTLRTEPSQLERMIDVAGPVVAWGGLPLRNVPDRGWLGESG